MASGAYVIFGGASPVSGMPDKVSGSDLVLKYISEGWEEIYGGKLEFIPDPDEMIKREKQNIFKALTDLTDDQKLLMDGIFDEFALSFKEIREEMMQTRDFQAMRPKMEALRKERDGLVRDVLNDDQYNTYLGVIEERRKQQRANRPQGNGEFPPPPPADGGNPPNDLPQ